MSFNQTPTWFATPIQINSTAISADGSRCILGTSSEYGSGLFSVVAYDGEGKTLWADPISDTPTYQGVFWVAVSNNGEFAAAGGETAASGDSRGFLRTYNAASGDILYQTTLPSRVNQVSLSEDGKLMVVAYGQYIALYQWNGETYNLLGKYDAGDNCDCGSAVINTYGSYASVAVTNYTTKPYTGKILCFKTGDGCLELKSDFATEAGAVRTAIDTAGLWWGASMHDGSCIVFSNQDYTKPAWHYQLPSALIDGKELGVAYGFDLVLNSNNETVIAVGANIEGTSGNDPMGVLFVLENTYVDSVFRPQLKWHQQLEYSPNPGVNMDLEATYVTATDGKPGDSNAETPGNLYLFERVSGGQIFKYPTPIMNWPMSISAKGNAIFAASDTGMGYYWKNA